MSSLQNVKSMDDFGFGHWKALVTKCGGLEKAIGVLRGDFEIDLIDVRRRFTHRGWRIPLDKLENQVKGPEIIEGPITYGIDYDSAFNRFVKAFGIDPHMTAAEFQTASIDLYAAIHDDIRLGFSTHSVCLPIIMPDLEHSHKEDIGLALDEVFLPALRKIFPEDSFDSNRMDPFTGKLWLHNEGDELIRRLHRFFRPQVALFFPFALWNYSPLQARHQVRDLPKEMILGGSLDMFCALIMHPDFLVEHRAMTPGYDLSAFRFKESDAWLYLLPSEEQLFLRETSPRDTSQDFTTSLLYLPEGK